LRIVNNSDTDIYFFYTLNDSLKDLAIFRNGYYKNSKGDSTYVQSDQYVCKKSFERIYQKGFNAWIDYFGDSKNGKIHFYIFADSVVNKYSDDEIKCKKMYERHFIYTKEELIRNGWTVTFP